MHHCINIVGVRSNGRTINLELIERVRFCDARDDALRAVGRVREAYPRYPYIEARFSTGSLLLRRPRRPTNVRAVRPLVESPHSVALREAA